MDFDEAKNQLKNSYIEAGLHLADEHPRELFFNCPPNVKNLFRISEQEIEEYAEFERSRSDFKELPTECSICSLNYREHLVTRYDRYDQRRFLPLSGEQNFIFGNSDGDNMYAEIGPATMLFVNFFRFAEDYCQLSTDRLGRRYFGRKENENEDMCNALYKPLTIRVYNLQSPNVETALKRSSSIIDACLFELSYLKDLTLKLEEEWSYRRPRVRPFRFGDSVKGNQLPMSQVKFNPDIVRFYQRGMGTDDPVDQFLAFYHILEYYFVTVSDEQLYTKLSRRINDPRFSTSPMNLDRIIQDTLNHKRETDETEMLKLVLSKYIDEAEIIEFIEAYEKYLDDRLYTKKRTIFGESIEIKPCSGHVIGNLAKRIKVIRNALVHSSDRYERQQRYIPTIKAEDMIRREIPLMRHLAERLIIASSE